MIENDEQACYRAMRWPIKYEMKLTESLEDINNKAAGKLRQERIFYAPAVILAFSTYVCDSSRVVEKCRHVTTLGR
jgi:hypothetical protein